MFIQLPFGHTEVRVDHRDPRQIRSTAALAIIRRVRNARS
jgi:hypothetical protein